MNRSIIVAAVAAASLAALAFAPATVSAASAPSAGETTLTVTGTSVTVTGVLAEDLPATAIVDDAGDVPVPMTGHDMTQYSVSFPEKGLAAFHLAVDANPATGFAPALTQYAINPTIGTTSIELTADATVTTPGQLEFAQQTCVAGPGGNTCTPTPVDGEYADGVITWFVPTGALPGTQVQGGQAEVNPFFEAVWLVNGLIDVMQGGFTNVPAATLLVDGDEVAVGHLSNDAGFTLTADLAPGTYSGAVVELCQESQFFNECSTVELDPFAVG